MGDIDSNAVSGVEVYGYRRGAAATDGWVQAVWPVKDRVTSYMARASTNRITGRAAATQNILSIFNTSATTLVAVHKIMLDSYSTAVKAIGTPPAIARVGRITAAPTGGNTMIKVPFDTAQSTDTAVQLLNDASTDGTNATILAATLTASAHLTQEVLSRIAVFVAPATGSNPYFEPADRIEFFGDAPEIILRQNQGLVLHLASPGATSIPATDFFTGTIEWEEFTRP